MATTKSEDGWKSAAQVKAELLLYLERMEKFEGNLYFESSDNYFYKLNAIRNYYKCHNEEIIKWQQCHPNSFYRAYPYDWNIVFTPIESLAWGSIRCKGNIPLYPQYPALSYYLDFGNPLKKIGLELDGKDYHNIEKDKKRDKELSEWGWKIYRVSGSQMNKTNYTSYYDSEINDYEEGDYKNLIRDWIYNTGDGVIEAIKVIHFNGNVPIMYDLSDWFKALCLETLNNHSWH